MKRTKMIITVLSIALILALCATLVLSILLYRTNTTVPIADEDLPPIEQYEYNEVSHSFAQVSTEVYPFTEVEIGSAYSVAQTYLDKMATENGTLTFDVEDILFNPMQTDVRIYQKLTVATEEQQQDAAYKSELRKNTICVTAIYSATYDHTKSPNPDAEHKAWDITLTREDGGGWRYEDSGTPTNLWTFRLLEHSEWANYSAYHDDAYILAGYRYSGTETRLLICDKASGAVSAVIVTK